VGSGVVECRGRMDLDTELDEKGSEPPLEGAALLSLDLFENIEVGVREVGIRYRILIFVDPLFQFYELIHTVSFDFIRADVLIIPI
jgi:hypothetical protein